MKNIIIILTLTIFFTTIAHSQYIQMEHWYINDYSNSKEIDFTNSSTGTYSYSVSNLPTPTIGYSHQEGTVNGMYDFNGNMIFYIEDGTVYDKNGINQGSFLHTVHNTQVQMGTVNECAIIPLEETCNEYFVVFSTLGNIATSYEPRVFYGKITLNSNNDIISITDEAILGGYSINSSTTECSFAISKDINIQGDKYLYLVEGNNQINNPNYYGKLDRFLITDNGITYQNTILNHNNPGQNIDYTPFEVELNHDGSQIAWGSTQKGEIYIVELDGTDVIHTYTSDISDFPKGIEFSPDGSKLFFSQFYGDIKYIDFNDNQTKIINGASAAISRHIELASDGYLYCLGSSINPNTLVIGEKTIPFTAFISNHSISTLPDQIDGYEYNSMAKQTSCCIEQNQVYTRTTAFSALSTTWTNLSNPFQDGLADVSTSAGFIVATGSKTIIKNMNIEFGPKAKVIVEPGALLILDNTKFTGLDNCQAMWLGVEVWGDRTKTQETWTSNGINVHQGRIIVKNSSEINNAQTAIQAIKENFDGSLDWSKTGGIIQLIENSKFTNNKRGIWLGGYKNYLAGQYGNQNYIRPLRSYIKNCNFSINDFFHGNINFHFFIGLYDGSSIYLKGNSFINSSSSAISERGCGIASFYSPINVSPSYLHIPYYHLDHHSTFEGLLYGIKAINFYSSEKHSITENDFTDCYHSIYLNNTSNTEILSNSFYIPVEDASINTPPYGIYLNGDYSFHIEDNEFAADYYPGTYGIIANELGAVNNELYRNHFVGLNYGIQPQQQNKGVIAGHRVGLKLFCNDFHNEKFDYDVLVLGKQIFDQLSYRHIGIADAQQIAVLNNPNQSYYPAGNEFSSQHEGGTFDFDNGQADYLVYFHENNTSLRFKPEYSVNIGLDNNLQVPENSCPSKLNGSGNIPTESALLTQAQLALNSSIVIRNIWKDGGNTNLENQVETTLPWDVYVEFNGLIAESPYLSDEVLMATINNPAFTSLMIKLIMVANPQASHNDEIMNAIYDRIPALPQSYIDAIRAGESTVSQLELLEANVSADYHLVRSIESNIIDIYRSDTINTNAYTNMLSFMTARPGLQDKYMLAATYLAHNDYTNMQSVLDAISTTFSLNNKETIEYQNSLTTFAIAKDIRQNDKHMGDLNETQMANLEAIVNQSGTNHAMALALLEWNNPEMELNELILHKPETNARKAAPDKQMDRPEIASVFKIYPNPAKDYFTLQYSNEIETMQNLSVIITDMQGRTIREEYFDNGTIYQLIDVLTLSAGLYSVSLYSGSLLLEVKQLNIVE